MSPTEVASKPRSRKICAAARQISARRASSRLAGAGRAIGVAEAERRWAVMEWSYYAPSRPVGRWQAFVAAARDGRSSAYRPLRDQNTAYEKLETLRRDSMEARGKASTLPGTTTAQWRNRGMFCN